jgi:hypothetical protein
MSLFYKLATPMSGAIRTRSHVVAIAAIAAIIGGCFLQEPLLGDDLTYWSFALDLHERGLSAWQSNSFYDLRWPVWSLCWLLQSVAGAGLFSYYGVPLLYSAAGAAFSFWFGHRLTSSIAAGWACGIAFVFHPFLDAGSYCPMPDLSEGVWGAAAMLAWWKLTHAENSRRASLCAVLIGLFVFIIEANRITGVFIVPVLVLCTALFFRRRFLWLIMAGGVALFCYAAECVFYHHLFGDWLHDLTANALNKGAKGTDFPNPWMLPFRFLDSFWKTPLVRVYSLLAFAGIWFAWRKVDVLGRVMVLWCAVLFLEYSCAPQSLSPIRPLVRDAPRFLSCLALPLGVLGVLGLWRIAALFAPARIKTRLVPVFRNPLAQVFAGLIAIAALIAATERNFFDRGFVPEFRRYLASVPDGTSIFTHTSMRDIVRLIDPSTVGRVRWFAHGDILQRDRELEAEAMQCQEFWYERKLAWLFARQRLEKQKDGPPPVLASYFAAPEREWTLVRSIIKGDTPDLVFYRKRSPANASPELLQNDAPAWRDIFPSLPIAWERGRSVAKPKAVWTIPEQFKGRLVRLELNATSKEVEAFTIRLRFLYGKRKQKTPFVLRPYLRSDGGTDFFALQIPATTTACEIQLRFSDKTKRVEFTRFRAVLEQATEL